MLVSYRPVGRRTDFFTVSQPAWRRRVRTFENRGALAFAMLGADAATLWLLVREPIAVSLRDGAILADGARLEALREQFSDYRPLPEAPPFLQAGLLGDGRSDHPFWFRQPDSVLVLHHDKVGGAGRLRVARVSGPAGNVVSDAPLGIAALSSSMLGETSVTLFGTVPNLHHDPQAETSPEEEEVLIGLNAGNGAVASYDLTAESLADTTPEE